MRPDNRFIHFEVFRYQLLPLTRHIQIDMFSDERFRNITSVEELKERKNEIMAYVLDRFPPLIYRESEINHKIDLNSPPWFVVEVNTQKSLKRERPDFEQERIDTWPHVVAIINNLPDVQLIAISRNTKAFSAGSVVAKILQDNLNRILRQFRLSIHVEALFAKDDFWHLVEDFSGRIRAVNFELISPNMANISKALELDLAKLNADTNSHRTDLKLNAAEDGVLELDSCSEISIS